MRVAMYYPWIYLRGGVERTILELSRRSRHDWTVFTSHYRPEDTFPGFAEQDVRTIGSVSVKRDISSVGRSCVNLLRQSYDWRGFDAVMVSCDGIGNLVALRSSKVPLLCLCHTPLKIEYDAHARDRWRRLFRPGIVSRAAVAAFKHVDKLAWKRYERVFCVSAEVERRLQVAGVVRDGQTEVAHPGVDLDLMTPTGRREPFFLLPGRIMWSKNIELGINAFIEYKARSTSPEEQRMRLVVAGMVDEKSRRYMEGLHALAAGRDDIEFVASPSDAQLLDLYDRSFAVLFTPPNEDWGIVPLEAMAFGKPVIAVNRGGPAESMVDGETGLLCEDNPSAFAAAIAKLSEQPALYERMSDASRRHVVQFGWPAFVGQIDNYLDGLARPVEAKQALTV